MHNFFVANCKCNNSLLRNDQKKKLFYLPYFSFQRFTKCTGRKMSLVMAVITILCFKRNDIKFLPICDIKRAMKIFYSLIPYSSFNIADRQNYRTFSYMNGLHNNILQYYISKQSKFSPPLLVYLKLVHLFAMNERAIFVHDRFNWSPLMEYWQFILHFLLRS